MSSLQDPASSVIVTRRFSSIISIDFACESANEELKMRLTYSYFTTQCNSNRIIIKRLALDTNSIVNDILNRIIIYDSPSIQRIVFCNKNATIHTKVIAVKNKNNIITKEYDTLCKFILRSKIIFSKELTENLSNEECS